MMKKSFHRYFPAARFNNIYKLRIKRGLDVFVSGILLLLAGPAIILIAIGTYLNFGSPVLFRQRRAGYKGQPIEIFKFRTMTDERDKNGELLPDSQRLKPFGEFLRRWSFDELPQLLNVIRGDLSLVGPRPLLIDYLELYSPEQAQRHNVKPGITGLAQVNGRNAIPWDEKFKWDVRYVSEVSFQLDMWILFKTAGKLIYPQDISQAGHATAERFIGSQPSIQLPETRDSQPSIQLPETHIEKS